MSGEWIQRHRLLLAWCLVGLLLAWLGVREGAVQWRELGQWRALAEQAAQLQGGPVVSLERLRQSAQARHIELSEVDTEGQGWQLRGQVANERVLQDWLQSLRAEGVKPLQWGLEQSAAALRFELVVQR
ncbi:type II secretion system protein GspM [Pantoea sp. Ap-967]|uniref:type II secretion system protein GspM n=1 Tax=Pantoea sp. Ap-967 TaxID=2608362 RepID=UPI001422E9D2|nr:type II secretion system protein GspM [Pantoea sp. Ap-967]NIE74492.1 type II secretion system protein GspM [Pantoea sp. Ap-967]